MTQIDLKALAKEKPIHFMGIGGAGMAPLAELVRLTGGQVTGCDLHSTPVTRGFEEDGVAITKGHDPSHIADCSALVVTSAIPSEHPEILAARERGIPVLKRAAALGGIVNQGYVVGIAGTHGKTTTTTLTTAVLEAAGLKPTGVIGGRVPAWGGNLRLGGDALFVVEADEFDRSFHQLAPDIAVVTTLEADHLDIFGTFEAVEDAFEQYVGSIPPEGLFVASGDESAVGRLVPRIATTRSVLTYGLNAGSMLRAENVEASGRTMRFDVREHGRFLGRATIQVPGLHNVRNALAAIGVARHLDAKWSDIAEGLAGYRGVDRRFQQIGEAGEVLVIDDYAHHPTEIRATLQAARSSYPGRRIVAVFQPHLYSRTRDFAREFGEALAMADLLFVTEIYPAREAPIEGVTGELIVTPAAEAGATVHYLEDRARVVEAVATSLLPGDVCLTLGAGDLNDAAREIVERRQGHG